MEMIKMKKILNSGIIALCLIFSGCDWLDINPETGLDETEVFTIGTTTRHILTMSMAIQWPIPKGTPTSSKAILSIWTTGASASPGLL